MITAEDLKSARERLGYSQAKFAKGLGVNQSTYSRWETGRRELRGPAQLLLERLLAEMQTEAAE